MKHQHLIRGAGRQLWWRRASRAIGIALLIAVTLGAAQLAGRDGTVLAATDLSNIGGQVTREGVGVSDALVVASYSGTTRAAATDATGHYALIGLLPGTYTLSVRPAGITTQSPDWVYAGDPLIVSVPPDAPGQNLIVAAATVTMTGRLAAPHGELFDAPNRAWVRAENQEGQGNSVQVAADGSFSVKVLPGAILLRLTLENQQWADPTVLRGMVYYGAAGQTVQVDGDPRTADPDPLQVVEKTASISGNMSIAGGGAAPAGIPVRAWRLDGAEFQQTLTDNSGNYTLQVISGTWRLRAVPLPEQPYVPAEPPHTLFIADSVHATQNLLIANADLTVHGRTVDSHTGEPLTSGVDGRAYALYHDPVTGQREAGPSAPLHDGVFTLKLSSTVAQSYTIGVSFPPDVPYTALSRVQLNVASVPALLDIPVVPNNSHIAGALRDRAGAILPGVAGSIWGASNSGGWARTRVNTTTGTYDLAVASTDARGAGGSAWTVRAFVDPTSGYIVQRPRVQQVFLPYNDGAGATAENVDFTLAGLDSFGVVHGQVTAPDGRPLPGVRVAVREAGGDRTTAFDRWTYTDLLGRYRVRVPAGRYHVSAHDGRQPPTAAPLIEPIPALVTVTAGGEQVANLRFRHGDALVLGRVTYQGAGHAALVHARSADGATVHTLALPGGGYALNLKAGLRWTIQAVSSDGSIFLRSNAIELTPVRGTQPAGTDLALAPAAPIPDSQVFAFQADEDQLFMMSDGSRVEVPAGALAESGPVVLTVRPLPELAVAGDAQPISFGYRLNAYDDLRRPISHFLRPVTLIVPFTADQLAALGVSIDRLVPSYWDEASASWKPVENVVVVPDGTGGGTVNITTDHFTDFALLGEPGGTLYLPLVSR